MFGETEPQRSATLTRLIEATRSRERLSPSTLTGRSWAAVFRYSVTQSSDSGKLSAIARHGLLGLQKIGVVKWRRPDISSSAERLLRRAFSCQPCEHSEPPAVAAHPRPPTSSLDSTAIPATAQVSRSERTGVYAWYVLGVLFLVYVLNFIDRSILSILAQDIKADLGSAMQQLGFLYGTAFAVFYGLFGIPLGRLADSWYRGRLIAAGLGVWSAMTALSGIAGSYGQTGIGTHRRRDRRGECLAGRVLAARRLLSGPAPRTRAVDLHLGPVRGPRTQPTARRMDRPRVESQLRARSRRHLVSLAGRWPFLPSACPACCSALWVLTLREPARGLAEGHPSPAVRPGAWRAFGRELAAILPPFTLWSVARFPGALRCNLLLLGRSQGPQSVSHGSQAIPCNGAAIGLGAYAVASWTQMLYATDRPTFALLFGTRAIVLALCGFGAIGFVSYSLFWAPSYAIRTFGVGADVAGLMLGVPGAFASAAGCVTGGHLSDMWKRRDPRGRLFVCMLAAILPAPLLFAALPKRMCESSTSSIRSSCSLPTSGWGRRLPQSRIACYRACAPPRGRSSSSRFRFSDSGSVRTAPARWRP